MHFLGGTDLFLFSGSDMDDFKRRHHADLQTGAHSLDGPIHGSLHVCSLIIIAVFQMILMHSVCVFVCFLQIGVQLLYHRTEKQ